MPALMPTVLSPRVHAAHRVLALLLRESYLSAGLGQPHRVLHARCERARLAGMGRPERARNAEAAYLAEVAAGTRLTASEEYRLAQRMVRGDLAARNALVEANLGLVVMFARRRRRSDVSLLDLVAEGNVGLLAATRGFDPERGFRFATYAKWYVRQAIERALPRLCGRLDMVDCAAPAPGSDEAPMSVEAMPEAAAPPEQEPFHATLQGEQHARLLQALATLAERDRLVISERFGLAGQGVATLAQLSQRLGVSIERVRQIESAALKLLARLLGDDGLAADSIG